MQNKNTKIIIFSEFSKKIGMGHFVRSKRLYEYLKKKNDILIYFNKKKIFIKNIISKYPVRTIFIFDFKSYNQIDINFNNNCRYVFFDKIKKNNSHEIIINPLYPETSEYSGPRWYPYSVNFFNKKNIYSKKKNKKKLLIYQGGTDAHNNLSKLAQIIYNKIYDLDVELSILAPKKYYLSKYLKNKYKIKVFKNVKNIFNFIKKFDHIVTSCGGFAYEVNFLGIDCTYVTSEPREIKLSKFLEKKGFGKFFNINRKNSIKKNIYKNLVRKVKKNDTNKFRYFRHNGLKNISDLIRKIQNEI